MSAITVAGVSRRFGEVTALRDVTLDVPVGQVTGLLGHNGAGKTTLLRVLTGLLRPHGGTVRVLGHVPTDEGRALRRRVGVLGESPGLEDLLTVRENLAVSAELNGLRGPGAAARIDAVLEELGLIEHRDRRVRGLSAGLRQRVALARAIVHEPELLLLDEPATNMDPVATRGVRDLMNAWAHAFGRTVVICTHDLHEAATSCDRVAILEHGTVLASGTPRELAERSAAATGVWITVAPGTADAARAALAAGGWRPRSDGGDTVTVDDVTRDQVPDVVAALVRAGVPVVQVTPTGGTLEDTYVALHHGQERS